MQHFKTFSVLAMQMLQSQKICHFASNWKLKQTKHAPVKCRRWTQGHWMNFHRWAETKLCILDPEQKFQPITGEEILHKPIRKEIIVYIQHNQFPVKSTQKTKQHCHLLDWKTSTFPPKTFWLLFWTANCPKLCCKCYIQLTKGNKHLRLEHIRLLVDIIYISPRKKAGECFQRFKYLQLSVHWKSYFAISLLI